MHTKYRSEAKRIREIWVRTTPQKAPDGLARRAKLCLPAHICAHACRVKKLQTRLTSKPLGARTGGRAAERSVPGAVFTGAYCESSLRGRRGVCTSANGWKCKPSSTTNKSCQRFEHPPTSHHSPPLAPPGGTGGDNRGTNTEGERTPLYDNT